MKTHQLVWALPRRGPARKCSLSWHDSGGWEDGSFREAELNPRPMRREMAGRTRPLDFSFPAVLPSLAGLAQTER